MAETRFEGGISGCDWADGNSPTPPKTEQARVVGLLMSGVWSAEDRYLNVVLRDTPGKAPIAFIDTFMPGVGPHAVTLGDRHTKFSVQQQLADAMVKQINDANEMKRLLRQLFELFDVVEESSNERPFRPTYITSCRVMHTNKLREIMPQLRKLCDSPPEAER